MTNEDALNNEITQEKLAELARFLKVLPERAPECCDNITPREHIINIINSINADPVTWLEAELVRRAEAERVRAEDETIMDFETIYETET